GHWVTRHQVIWLDTAGTASSGKAVGLRVNWYDPLALVRHCDRPGLDSGHWVTRHQSFGFDSGTASSGKAVGSESTAHDSEAPGHQVPDCLARQRASGPPGIRSFGLFSGAPRHLARQWAPGHQALDRLARQSGIIRSASQV
ncbi:unnamed protein product, partial [Staurois parvus]